MTDAKGDAEDSSDDEVEMYYPGHKVDMRLAKRPDPNFPNKPYVVKAVRGLQYPDMRFETAEEADKYIEETQRRSERGMKDSDKSQWD